MTGPEERPFDIVERTFLFALETVKACRQLERRSWVARTLGAQLLRSATSVGANMEEAQAAQSRRDFVSKASIALKEARESGYWLRILLNSGILTQDEGKPLHREAHEISRILGSIIVSTRRNGL